MELKDSGFSWIRKIPVNWEVRRVKQVFHQKKEKAFIDNPTILSLARDGVKIRDISTNEGQLAADYSTYNPVSKNDLLLNPMDLYSGDNCNISRVTGVISPAYVNLRNICQFDTPEFFNYYFKYQYWSMAFFAHGRGVSFDNRWTLTNEVLRNYPVLYPPVHEQKAIADYLDKECARIDNIVEKQRNIIEKLKEYKKSVITEAVTKGLNPNVTMKDSGIEWIGKIPAHWEVCKIKNIICSGKDGIKIGPFGSALTGKTRDVGEYRVYSQANLVSDNFDFAKNYIEKSDLDLFQNYIIKSEDILLSMMGTIGKCKIMPKNKPLGIMDSHLLKIRLSSKYIPKFFAYVYDKDSSNVVISQLLYYSKGSIMDGLNSSIVKNIQIPLASLSEQQAIIEYLDQKCGVIDSVIEKRERMIELLTEYKKSLIYECVTGKKEVA